MIAVARPEATAHAEVLHRSPRTLVTRQPGADTGTIRKQFLGPHALARMRNEARAYARLTNLECVPKLLAVGPGAALLFRDAGGAPPRHDDAGEPLLPLALVAMAMRLARGLGEIHRRGVLHLDISPSNLLAGGSAGPQLIDFDLANVPAEERRAVANRTDIAGTLEYMAPELTGRTSRSVDQRTDLYAFGASLYELATGAPPFGRGDALKLIQEHAATLPVPPATLRPTIPRLFSDIILRLLEKAPDRRYQSADGLADDLERLHRLLAELSGQPNGGAAAICFPLGSTDFPSRLGAPERLFGRDGELAVLSDALNAALTGAKSALLLTGAAGVGKTALLAQLRPLAARQGGWFLSAKFEPEHRDGMSSPIVQVLRGLIARLQAEPEAELAAAVARIRSRLGDDPSALLTVVPEAAALVGGVPASVTEQHARAACIGFLAAAVTPARPVVIALDDAQWAPADAVRFIGDLLAVEKPSGLLLALACRDPEAAGAFGAAMRRWERGGIAPRRLEIRNLPPPALADMLGEVLRMPPDAAIGLAEAAAGRTSGNPLETLELLNSLRHEGILKRGADGWSWDPAQIRRHVGQYEPADMLRERVAGLPVATRDLLADMACLGAEMAPAVLAVAAAASSAMLAARLAPAQEEGLVLRQAASASGAELLCFRHDGVRQAIYDAMPPEARRERHLALARRLAAAPAQEAAAADAYLHAIGAPLDPAEALRAAALLAGAAERAMATFLAAAAERYYAAATGLLEAHPAADEALLARLRTRRLLALYSLGDNAAIDRLFAAISEKAAQTQADPLQLAEATCVQVLSLTNQGKHLKAMQTGLGMLEFLGFKMPADDLAGEIRRGMAELALWLRAELAADPAIRRFNGDKLLRTAARLISRMLPAAQLLDPPTGAWLALESQRLWARHGVCPEVVASLARSAAAANIFSADFRVGYEMARYAVTVGQACGYEPETSLARQNLATFALHWFERLENTLEQVNAASSGLIQSGEVQAACINHISALAALFDCAPTLESYSLEAAAAREFTGRTGNEKLFAGFGIRLQPVLVLTGQLEAAPYIAAEPSDTLRGEPLGCFDFCCSHAIVAALFDDAPALARHSGAALALLPRIGGAYRTSTAKLLRALSLARDLRGLAADAADAAGDARPGELQVLRAWLAARAKDAPANFQHVCHFLDAEIAWSRGDTKTAIAAFDCALQGCAGLVRPWHHALIAERAGLCHLAYGLDYSGRFLLRDACGRYAAWGASAVVRRLTAAHGFLDGSENAGDAARDGGTGSITSDTIDLLAILRTSQALSSQTTIAGLNAHVAESLAAMTGATSCQMAIREETNRQWYLPASRTAPEETIEAAAARGVLPLSAFRYVERTRLPLLVDDARLDDRFCRDPYFDALSRCSLLLLPIETHGTVRAILMLENRLSSGVFSPARLNIVTLVASQLAVSLENAKLYASLEKRIDERTAALASANSRLQALSMSDGLTGLANRRRFDAVLAAEWARCLQAGESLAVVLVDIDHFKRFNDHYGHVSGDHCLRAVAAALGEAVAPESDLAARYGGEEFALILPGADIAGARIVAARARDAVAAMGQPHARSPYGYVTISLGAAAGVPQEKDGQVHLVEQADAALYRAKQQGRNRVCCDARSAPPGEMQMAAQDVP